MVEPAPLVCPHCGSADVRPADASPLRQRPVIDARFQHCEHCGHDFRVPGHAERRAVARAGFEADLKAIAAENERLLAELRRVHPDAPKHGLGLP